jgi:hypothetical protein
VVEGCGSVGWESGTEDGREEREVLLERAFSWRHAWEEASRHEDILARVEEVAT